MMSEDETKIYPDDCRVDHPRDCPDPDCDYCSEFYQTCDECGCLIHNDTVRGVDGDERALCYQCLDKINQEKTS